MHRIILFISFIFFSGALYCQPAVQTASKGSAKNASEWSPNPTTAAFLSAAFPGAGQIYSRAYLHSPIFILSEGYCAWRAIDSWQQANTLWDERNSLTPGTAEYESARSEFDYYTNERNTYLWMLAGVKFLDIVDAYITAQLYHFDEQMETPISIEFVPTGDGAKVALNIRF